MSMIQRLLLAFGILLVDGLLFFLPLSALFLAYVLIFNPPWVRTFLLSLESEA